MKPRMHLVGLWFLVLTASCREEGTNSPESAYREFIEALRKGRTAQAWTSLSPLTKQRAQERSKAIAEASMGALRDQPELLLFATRPTGLDMGGEVNRVRADENTAILEVSGTTGRQKVKLVKESGKWLLDLSDSLQPGAGQ